MPRVGAEEEMRRQQRKETIERRERRMPRLWETFKEECERVSGRVSLARSGEEVERSLSEIVAKEGVRRVMLGKSPLLRGLDLEQHLRDCGIDHMVRSSNEPLDEETLRDFLRRISDSEMGITGVDYGLADTGTLVLMARSDQDRLTSLLPPVHVAVLQTDRILTGLEELCVRLMWDREEGCGLDSCITLITGPSKTADIEFSLVRGIHGPKEVYVILWDPKGLER
jgi:L-lactate dehydrogenase complex protein LldG